MTCPECGGAFLFYGECRRCLAGLVDVLESMPRRRRPGPVSLVSFAETPTGRRLLAELADRCEGGRDAS